MTAWTRRLCAYAVVGLAVAAAVPAQQGRADGDPLLDAVQRDLERMAAEGKLLIPGAAPQELVVIVSPPDQPCSIPLLRAPERPTVPMPAREPSGAGVIRRVPPPAPACETGALSGARELQSERLK